MALKMIMSAMIVSGVRRFIRVERLSWARASPCFNLVSTKDHHVPFGFREALDMTQALDSSWTSKETSPRTPSSGPTWAIA